MTHIVGGPSMSGPPDERPPAPAPAPSVSGPLPAWLRYLTHLTALGWGTAELALWGGRTGAFAFIGLVLVGSEGTRALSKVHQALRS